MSSAASTLRPVADALRDALQPDPATPGPTRFVHFVANYVGFVATHPAEHARLVRAGCSQDADVVAVIDELHLALIETVLASLELD